jgi:hypothetical protein
MKHSSVWDEAPVPMWIFIWKKKEIVWCQVDCSDNQKETSTDWHRVIVIGNDSKNHVKIVESLFFVWWGGNRL